MGAGIERLEYGRRDFVRRFHRDAIEREVHLQHARQRGSFIDADLRADKRMLARLEDDALVGTDRLVARVAVDLYEADGQFLLWLPRGGAAGCAEVAAAENASAKAGKSMRMLRALIIDHHAPWHAADRDRDGRLAALDVDERDVVAKPLAT